MSRLGSLLADWGDAWSSLEPERRNGVLLFSGLGLVVLTALALIGYGYYTENIAFKSDTVLTVGQHKLSYAVVERRLTRELRRGNLTTFSPDVAVLRAFLLIEEEEVLRQGANDLGIVVNDQELDDRLHGHLGVPAEAPPASFAAAYGNAVLLSGLTVTEYRELLARDVLVDKVRTYFGDAVPAESEQVDLLLILLSDRDTAAEAKERLDGGEPFAEVAASLSLHASSREGGAAGWFPQGGLPPAVNEAAFSLPFGETSEVIEVTDFYATPAYFYLVQPRAREVRAVDDDGRDTVIDQAYENFLRAAAERLAPARSLSAKHLSKLAEHAIAVVTGG